MHIRDEQQGFLEKKQISKIWKDQLGSEMTEAKVSDRSMINYISLIWKNILHEYYL